MNSSAPIAAIEQIEKALEGVTPGPWDFEPVEEHSVRPTVATFGDYRVVRSGRGSRGYDLHGVDEADAAYIAACSPDVMPGILALARKAEEMERENAELRRIGGGMANVLHHWKQQSTIRESDRLLMAVMQEEWDAVPAARSLTKGESDAGN